MLVMRVDVQDITIPIGDIELEGSLAIPAAATGLVMFAHGSGSSRHSPRNGHVASLLHERQLATAPAGPRRFTMVGDQVHMVLISSEARWRTACAS